MRHARHSANLEHGLRLGTQGDCGFKGVLDAMAAQQLEQVCGVLVDDDVAVGDMDSESVGNKVFFFLCIVSIRR